MDLYVLDIQRYEFPKRMRNIYKEQLMESAVSFISLNNDI